MLLYQIASLPTIIDEDGFDKLDEKSQLCYRKCTKCQKYYNRYILEGGCICSTLEERLNIIQKPLRS